MENEVLIRRYINCVLPPQKLKMKEDSHWGKMEEGGLGDTTFWGVWVIILFNKPLSPNQGKQNGKQNGKYIKYSLNYNSYMGNMTQERNLLSNNIS